MSLLCSKNYILDVLNIFHVQLSRFKVFIWQLCRWMAISCKDAPKKPSEIIWLLFINWILWIHNFKLSTLIVKIFRCPVCYAVHSAGFFCALSTIKYFTFEMYGRSAQPNLIHGNQLGNLFQEILAAVLNAFQLWTNLCLCHGRLFGNSCHCVSVCLKCAV